MAAGTVSQLKAAVGGVQWWHFLTVVGDPKLVNHCYVTPISRNTHLSLKGADSTGCLYGRMRAPISWMTHQWSAPAFSFSFGAKIAGGSLRYCMPTL